MRDLLLIPAKASRHSQQGSSRGFGCFLQPSLAMPLLADLISIANSSVYHALPQSLGFQGLDSERPSEVLGFPKCA